MPSLEYPIIIQDSFYKAEELKPLDSHVKKIQERGLPVLHSLDANEMITRS